METSQYGEYCLTQVINKAHLYMENFSTISFCSHALERIDHWLTSIHADKGNYGLMLHVTAVQSWPMANMNR